MRVVIQASVMTSPVLLSPSFVLVPTTFASLPPASLVFSTTGPADRVAGASVSSASGTMIQLRFFICVSFIRGRRRPPSATVRVAPAPRPAGLEAHAYGCPELIVVADVVDVVEEEPSLADEVRLVRRTRAQRDAEVQHPRRCERVAAGQIPKRDAGADERAAVQIAVYFGVGEQL